MELYTEDGSGANRALWIAHCQRFLASPERPTILKLLDGRAGIALHGSTTRNVADAYSDLDCYLILDEGGLAQLDATDAGRFIEFEVEGKSGHLNVITHRAIEDAFAAPNFELIYELRHAEAVIDPDGFVAAAIKRAQLPMSERVRCAGLMHNYMEMRSFHRSADNPMDRRHHWAALTSVVKAVNYALRCARIIDGKPYPYDKWLYLSAAQTITGREVITHLDQILALLYADPSALDGPERENLVSLELRAIRRLLVERAEATGIDAPWLLQWWRALDEQRAIYDNVEWPR